MAANNDDIPPIPLPPAGNSIPPVEPPPVTPPAAPTTPETPVAPPSVAPPAEVPPAAPAAPLLPVDAGAPVPLPPVAPAARPDPYAQPSAQATYAPPGAVPPTTPPPAYGTPGYAYTAPAAGPPQGLALASMIIGIASVLLAFFSVGLLPAIAAVVLGHLAQRRQSYARPLWLTGLVTGYVGLGISLIWGLFLLIGIIASVSSYGY